MELYELFGQIFDPHQAYANDDPTNEPLENHININKMKVHTKDELDELCKNLPF